MVITSSIHLVIIRMLSSEYSDYASEVQQQVPVQPWCWKLPFLWRVVSKYLLVPRPAGGCPSRPYRQQRSPNDRQTSPENGSALYRAQHAPTVTTDGNIAINFTPAGPCIHKDIIYGVWGVLVPPLFGLGYRTPTFRTHVKNLLSTAVNRGDLQRLNYNKTVFSRYSAPVPARAAHRWPRTP